MTQRLRKITVEYGQDIPGSILGPSRPWSITSEGSDDYRVQFSFTRTNTNHADTGRVIIYNLPPELSDAISEGTSQSNTDREDILVDPRYRTDIDARNAKLQELAKANLVKVYAGYVDDMKLIFTGDITDLNTKAMGSGVDEITTITLGDTIIPLKYGWLNKTFGDGATTGDILNNIMAGLSIGMSEQALAFQAESILGVEVASFKDGMFIFGGVKRNVDAIVARYGVQWFIRDGEFYFMPRGSVIDDFFLRLNEGENILRPISKFNGDDIKFTMLLDGDVLPGRGFVIENAEGERTSNRGYRADTVTYIGDTHSNPWYCMVAASRLKDEQATPRFVALTPSQAITSNTVAVP
jgi:hypothetical protein